MLGPADPCDILCVAMRRVFTAGLLSICLGVFLCPAVGRLDASSLIGLSSLENQTCRKPAVECPEAVVPADGCCSHQDHNSQPSHCCPAPCSALILMYS